MSVLIEDSQIILKRRSLRILQNWQNNNENMFCQLLDVISLWFLILAKFEELALWDRFNEFGMIEKEMGICILKEQ